MSEHKWPESAPRKRIWVQHVAVETDKIQMRVAAARARGDLTESQEIIADGVTTFAKRAQLAAFRDDPVPNRLANWWRGTLPEAAYRQMHTARTQMIDLYDESELQAEIPSVVARANASLHRDDPRQLTVEELRKDPPAVRRARIRRLVGDSYERLDLEHAQLRSFRNILLSAATFLILITLGTIVFVSINPDLMPLCFPGACPTSNGRLAHPQSTDIQVVAVLGALGGALAATLSIRNLKGTSTPYDVPVALAALKVPLGALTAILGLVAIQGMFIPGLSQLDSQGQILAYALVLGFAQQAFSRLLDKQAQTLLEGLPGGTDVEPTPKAPDRPPPPPPATPPVTWDSAPLDPQVEEPGSGAGDEPAHDASADGEVEASDAVLTEDTAAEDSATEDTTADRPVDEPEDATQQDQLDQLSETVNDRHDMSEVEEAELLKAEFGPADANGIYGAPTGGGDAPSAGENPPPVTDKEG
jgi:hypothetical protein